MKIGEYELGPVLGRGGVGVVYRARSADGREVALKVLSSRDAPRVARFDRERRLLSTFSEAEGFVPLLDSGVAPEGPFIVMPLMEGGTLRARVERGPMPVDVALWVARSLSRAMAAAHEKGIVHRDLKPENVLFTADGRPLIADLGLAKHFDQGAPGASQSVMLSAAGGIRGTAGYMAPEQMEDASGVGPPADVFALGAIAWECLAGRPAFGGDTLIELVTAVVEGRAAPIRTIRPEVPSNVEAVLARALDRDPAKRYADGAAVLRALGVPESSSITPEAAAATLVIELEPAGAPRTLEQHLRETTDIESSMELLAKLCRDVHRMHERGEVHRDIRPATVSVDRNGVPSLRTGPRAVASPYRAPEQVTPGARVDLRADVWALGAVMYELLVGRPPFVAPTLDELDSVIRTAEPVKPSRLRPQLTLETETVCLHALAKRPDDRYESAQLLADDIEALMTGRPILARPRGLRARLLRPGNLAGGALLVAGLTASGLWLGERRQREIADGARASGPRPTSWPAPSSATSWRWRLADGSSRRLAPALWESDEVAAPLARVHAIAPGALEAAFAGRARAIGEGRVAVRYGATALRAVRERVGRAATMARGPVITAIGAEPDGIRVQAENDAATAWASVGSAVWRDPSVRVEIRETAPVDLRVFFLAIGESAQVKLSLECRSGFTSAVGPAGATRVRHAVGAALAQGVEVRFRPGGPKGSRIGVGRETLGLDDALADPPPVGGVFVGASEADFALRGLEVSGVPLKVDRPALAKAPSATPPSFVAAAFELLDGPAARGGPLVVLDSSAGERLALELDGERAMIVRDDEVLASTRLDSKPRRGWMLLERRGGVLDGRVAFGDRAPVRLEAADPLTGTLATAAWGTTGPRTRFVDAAAAGGPESEPSAAATRWRRGARELARIACPRRLDPSCCGTGDTVARQRIATAESAAADLEASLSGGLSPAAFQDALARAALANALATRGEVAAALADRLCAEAGSLRAREIFQSCGFCAAAGLGVLDAVAEGWSPHELGAVRRATIALARAFYPDRADLDFVEATVDHEEGSGRRGRPYDAELLERARAGYRRASALGHPRLGIAPAEAVLLDDLKDHAGAITLWREAIAAHPGYAFFWQRLTNDLARTNRDVEATEAAVACVAYTDGASRRQQLASLVSVSRRPAVPKSLGLSAVYVAARAVGDAALADEARREAAELAPPAGSREADLVALVLDGPLPDGDRPTAVLVRAARGDATARAALAAAAAKEPLVRHLALLDPALAPLVE